MVAEGEPEQKDDLDVGQHRLYHRRGAVLDVLEWTDRKDNAEDFHLAQCILANHLSCVG